MFLKLCMHAYSVMLQVLSICPLYVSLYIQLDQNVCERYAQIPMNTYLSQIFSSYCNNLLADFGIFANLSTVLDQYLVLRKTQNFISVS